MRPLAYAIERFGQEREPIIIIDGFCGELDRVVAHGRSANYVPVQGYPGIRAPANVSYLSPQSEALADILYDHFGFSVGFRAESCNYSIVTTVPEDLRISQRIPHYDDTGANLLALLHYTGTAETGGTAFYRHRRTGFEFITPDRVELYRQALQADDTAFGLPPPQYCYGDSQRYEMIGKVEARPDRMVIYRGRILHSGIIPTNLRLAADPARGRLTINTFVVGVS